MKRLGTILWLCIAAGALPQTAVPSQAGLAFCRQDGGFWQIWLADAEGQSARGLTSSPLDKRCLKPVRERQQLIFRDNQGKLYLLDLKPGVQPKSILTNIEVVKDYDFNLQYGYLVSSYAPNAQDNIRVWWCSEDERDKRLVVPDVYLNEMPRWMPDGKSFLFVKSHLGKSQVFRSTFETPKAEPLFAKVNGSTTEPAPSPEGKWVAYCQEGPQGMDLWLADANGLNARQVYAGPGLEAEPSWDSSGARLYFSTWDGKNFRIACINIDGTKLHYLTPEGADCRYPIVVEHQHPLTK